MHHVIVKDMTCSMKTKQTTRLEAIALSRKKPLPSSCLIEACARTERIFFGTMASAEPETHSDLKLFGVCVDDSEHSARAFDCE